MSARYAVRIGHNDTGATTFLRGTDEVAEQRQAEQFATEDAATDAGFLFVLRTPGTHYDVIEMEVTTA